MLKIYFDDVLINEDSYAELNNEYKLFNDSFYLGSTASNTFELKVLKSSVASHPDNVTIEDDNTTFHLIVDEVLEEKGFYNYTLVDKMVNFNFNYDAKPLIDEKIDLEEETYLSDILADMCLKAGVELDYVMTNDIIVSWYDSRIQARDYLSFIAELEGGYACIDELGKLTIKPHKQTSNKEISVDEVSELIIGEKKTITRVVYDGGAFKWEFGDDTGNTLYLNSNNVFITDELVVENIYNKIVGFEFYTITVPNTLIDSSIKAGDVITFVDGLNEYQTIAQYSSSYAGGWVGSYDFNINTEKQEETNITRTADNVRNLQVNVNRLNNEFGIIAEEIEKLTDYIRNVGNTGDYLALTDTPKSSGAINTLSIKGFELMLYPGMAYPSEYTYPGALSFYTLVFDTVPTFDNEPNYVFVNSPIPLQKLGSVHDELLIEQNKVKVIQRIGYDFDNEQWSVLSTPITHELNDVLLPTFDGDTYVSVRYFDNLIYDAEYLVKNDLTSNFATQLESSSQFKLNQDEISSKVSNDEFDSTVTQLANGISSKVSKGEIVSEINQSEEAVKIEAQKIKLEGLTTVNENFKVLLDGSIEAKNGNFQGNVTADNLYLNNGGRVISGDGILTNLQFQSANGDTPLGWYYDYANYHKMAINIAYTIPSNFTIVSAFIILYHIPIYSYLNGDGGTTYYWGYSREIKPYKMNQTNFYLEKYGWTGLSFYGDFTDVSEIASAFGSSGFTANVANSSSHSPQTATSNDISTSFSSGESGMIVLKTSQSNPSSDEDSLTKTGQGFATLNFIGYTSVDE